MNENLNPDKDDFSTEDYDVEKKLRPLSFEDFTGQEQVLDTKDYASLKMAQKWAAKKLNN